MSNAEIIRKAIKETQKEWEKMNLKSKRKKILEYWTGKLRSETEQEKINFIHNQIIMTEELDKPEIVEYLEIIHNCIMEHARQLEKESHEEEGD